MRSSTALITAAILSISCNNCAGFSFQAPAVAYHARRASRTVRPDHNRLHSSSQPQVEGLPDDVDVEIVNPFETPPEMMYKPVNIRRQLKYFESIRAVGGQDCVADIYCRDNGSHDKKLKQTFWFIGKVSRCTGTVSLNEAVGRQWNLIEEHAARLRHVELGPSFKDLRLEIWAAPGDTEMDMAQNRLSTNMEMMYRLEKSEWEKVPLDEVGFEGELQDGEEGFRVLRTDDGHIMDPKDIAALEK